jgi:hypothetical protein
MKTGTYPGFSFWFQWMLLNAVGWTMGMMVRQFLFGIRGFATNLILVGGVIGLVVGLAQLFAMAQPGRQTMFWVFANVIGWAVGWGLGWELGWELLGTQGFKGVFGTVGAVGGFVSGIIQWMNLRQEISRAGWWILFNTAGWAIGLAVGVTVIGGPFGWAAAGAISGGISGLCLIWLYRRFENV